MAKTRLPEKYKNFSVSNSTLRTEDLFEAFTDMLQYAKSRERVTLSKRSGGILNEAAGLLLDKESGILNWEDRDHIDWLVNEGLMDALNDIAPTGCYFGAHPGDGADFGFWEDEDW